MFYTITIMMWYNMMCVVSKIGKIKCGDFFYLIKPYWFGQYTQAIKNYLTAKMGSLHIILIFLFLIGLFMDNRYLKK